MKICRLFLLLIVVLGMAACMPTLPLGNVKTDSQSKNEIIMTNDLKQHLAENPKPKIVFRIASVSHNVVEAESLNRHVNTMEKVFVESGFTVRDRLMLEETLKRTQMLDYKAVGKQIDTDLIIEILDLRFDVPNHVTTYLNKMTNQKEQFLYTDNYIDCQMAKLECRITIVGLGQVGGMFTFYSSRCDYENLDFVVDRQRGTMIWPEKADTLTPKWFPRALNVPINTEESIGYFTARLTHMLINQLMSGSLGQLRKALDLGNEGRYAEALEIMANIIKKDPQNSFFHTVKGSILVKQKDLVGAAAELERALLYANDKSSKSQLFHVYARLYAQKNESQMALSYLRKALENGADVNYIRKDEELVNISQTPEFDSLLKEFKK